ncbi:MULTISPECIES: SRPBCC family protein [unclassified Diaminobutyricimonas]|uniref:SRPBCC family protein n=1 Tax=unclassified Diaminobutyricimonas TaxID=2643261 RepID=UPI0012F51750|nr:MULTISPECIES: SRPBCC family protein [unclassified Diaminobutyricimonas]
MTTIEKSIDIDVPISTVYNQWTQFESFPQFMGGVDSVRQVTPTRTVWAVSVGGVKREFTAEITEQHPDERIAWASIDEPRHAGVVTFHRLSADQTRVTLQMDWQPEGLVEKAGAALQVDDVQVGSDLKKFKELIEDRGFEEGGWRGDVDRDADATGR